MTASLAPAPTEQRRDPPRRRPSRGWLPDALAVLVLALVVLAAFYEMPFEGRMFGTAPSVLGVEGCGRPSGACTGIAPDDLRQDPSASAWALEPWGRVTHELLADRTMPLWDPYQAAGTPFVANMQSAVFDPLLLAYHLHPTPLVLDLTLLAGFFLMALAAYLAARTLRLSPLSATISGSIYALSGWFFRFSNNQWFRAYIFLPLLVAAVEWTLRSKRRWPLAATALAVAGLVLIGMPEPTFITLIAVSAYAIVRLFVGPRAHDRPRALVRLAVGGVLGLLLSAPALVPFLEYVPLSFNSHSTTTNATLETLRPASFLNWLMPRVTGTAAQSYATTANWVGTAAVLLAAVAIATPRAMRRYLGWALAAIGGLLALQVYGGVLVQWTRLLPVWPQIEWAYFATPVVAFVLAILAGIGVQAVADGAVERRRVVIAVGVVLGLIALSALIERDDLAAFDFSWFGGWALALVVGIVVVAAVLLLAPRTAALVIAVVVVLELVALAPRGIYYPRADQYPAKDWVGYLGAQTATDHSRVFSTDGLLFPDTSGVYGIQDAGAVDALYVDRYWKFIRTFVAHRSDIRFAGAGPVVHVGDNPMFDLLGVRYLTYYVPGGTGPPAASASQFRSVFQSDFGHVYENLDVIPRSFVVQDVQRVDDEDAALAHLARGGRRTGDGTIIANRVDPRESAVVEADPGDAPAVESCSGPSSSRIVSYSADRVKVEVDSACAGLLVLTDSYFPGWKATVDGKDSRIYATDVAFRGVRVPAGASVVEFEYHPSSFRNGVILAVLGVGGVVALVVSDVLSRRRRRRRARGGQRQEAAT